MLFRSIGVLSQALKSCFTYTPQISLLYDNIGEIIVSRCKTPGCKPLDVRPLNVKPLDVRSRDVCPLEVRSLDVRPLDVRPLNVRSLDLRPLDVNFAHPLGIL